MLDLNHIYICIYKSHICSNSLSSSGFIRGLQKHGVKTIPLRFDGYFGACTSYMCRAIAFWNIGNLLILGICSTRPGITWSDRAALILVVDSTQSASAVWIHTACTSCLWMGPGKSSILMPSGKHKSSWSIGLLSIYSLSEHDNTRSHDISLIKKKYIYVYAM